MINIVTGACAPLFKKGDRNLFTPLESPDIYAGDVINRKHQLLVKAGSKPYLSNGVYSVLPNTANIILKVYFL